MAQNSKAKVLVLGLAVASLIAAFTLSSKGGGSSTLRAHAAGPTIT